MPLLDDEQPTENTPLLSTSDDAGTTFDALPAVNPVVAQLGADLRSTGSLALNVGDFPDWCPDTLPSDSQRTAFILVVLLNLLALRYNQATNHSGSVWEQWSTEKQDACDVTSLQREIVNVWNNFIGEFRTTGDIEDLLWSSFPLAEDGETCIRGLYIISSSSCLVFFAQHICKLSISSIRITFQKRY